jgi:two-component system cell cycle response regulator
MAVHPKYEELKVGGRLPSPKGAALRVIGLTQKENVSNQEVAQAIKADPALSGRVVRMANALVAYQTRPVASVADAVTVSGLNTIRQMVLGLSLLEDSREGACKGFDYNGFWSRSLLRAIAAQNLVHNGGIGSVEEVFILGLLSEIGSLALATAHPERYSLVLDKVAAGTELAVAEQAEFGLNHNQVGKEMLADWGMPRVFQEVALYHETPEQAGFAEDSRDWRLLNVLHVADYFAKMCMAEEQHRRKMLPKLLLLSTRLGVETDMLTEIGDKTVGEWREWGKLFGINTVDIPPFADLLKAVPLAPEMFDVEALQGTAAYKLRILLVDDDLAILMMLQTLLTQAGHTVTTARDGREALRRVEESIPQLIITDWVMPEMDGIEFCKALRQNPAWRNIHVFIVTAQESINRLVEAFEAGANDYMTKPINFKVLGARLHAGQRVVQLQEELEFDRQQLRKFAAELAASNQRLQKLALTDVLTGLYNRRYANESLERHWSLAERNKRPLACMMVDIDRFKQINDTYGHKMGDDALKQVANVLRASIRKQDEVCRLGGEEFLLICPEALPEQMFQYAERLRQNVSSSRLLGADGQEFHLTVSIGVASKSPELLNVEMLLQLADKNLYAAKKGGRNMTVAS